MRLRTTSRFEKDLKSVVKRNKDLNKLWAVVERLSAGQRLELRHRQHRLSGTWSSCCECHIGANRHPFRLVRIVEWPFLAGSPVSKP